MYSWERVESELAGALLAAGLDLSEEGLQKTAGRIARFWGEFLQGGHRSAQEYLQAELNTSFETPNTDRSMVIQAHIPFRGLCEHHFLPFVGEAALGYIPNKRVIGISKLTRLVQAAGVRRPSIQERITNEIADALVEGLEAQGAIVVIRAEHMCMAARGVAAPSVWTTTSAVRGLLMDDTAARAEFLALTRG